MDMLDEIKSSLQINKDLDKDIKSKLFQLIIIFNKKFPSVKLDNLNERLKSLRVGRLTKYERRGIMVYDGYQNEILISNSNLKNGDYDLDNLFMKALLCIITCNGNFYGFNSSYELEALNEAYTEILANYVIGNDGDSNLEEEVLFTNLISQIIGKDTLFDAYFSNDGSKIVSAMNELEDGV